MTTRKKSFIDFKDVDLSRKIGRKIVLTSWDGKKKITGYIRNPNLTQKGEGMRNKVHSCLINLLMSILCIVISNYDYPKEWDEKDLMVRLSRKLMEEGNEYKFVIIPFYQWECMNLQQQDNHSGNPGPDPAGQKVAL